MQNDVIKFRKTDEICRSYSERHLRYIFVSDQEAWIFLIQAKIETFSRENEHAVDIDFKDAEVIGLADQ